MAKIAVTISVIFSLVLVSHAHIPSTLPDDSVPFTTTQGNDQNTLHLRNEKTETDTTVTIPVSKIEPDAVSDTISVIGIHNIRPFNSHIRQMPGKRQFGFRLPHRCRHPHRQVVSIPYGNDMIPAQGFGGNMRQIPAKGFGFPGDRHRFPVSGGYLKDDVRGSRVEFGEAEGKKEMGKGGFMKWFQDFINRF